MTKLSLWLAILAMSAATVACSKPDAAAPAAQDLSTANAAAPSATPATPPAPSGAVEEGVLGLSGLGGLKIGEAVPADGAWSTPGGQTGNACRAVRSAAYPGVYALVEGGQVRRITVGPGSNVKLAEGVGVGASEAEVQKWFAGFRSEPHKYEDAPAKYLTAPNAADNSSALRFEIDGGGKVKMMHVGLMPQLAYVEACG